MAQIIKHEFPSSTLRYGNKELNGTIEGRNVKIYYRIIRASNGEVAGLPVIVLDGQKYDDFDGYFTEKTITDKLGKLLSSTSKAAASGTRLSLVRKSDTDEWVVKVFIDGKYDESKSYYTDDKQDAINTMSKMKKDMGITASADGQAVAAELVAVAELLAADENAKQATRE